MKYVLRTSVARTRTILLYHKTESPNLTTSRKTHYDTLKITKSASSAEVKAAYFELSKKYHPDKHKNDKAKATEFVKINEAYSVLSNGKLREAYDAADMTGFGEYRHQSYNREYQSREYYSQWDNFGNHTGSKNYGNHWREYEYDPFVDEERKKRMLKTMKVRTILITFLVLFAVIRDIFTDNQMFRNDGDIDRKWHLAVRSVEAIKNFQGENVKDQKGNKKDRFEEKNKSKDKD